ncbi:chymotrypsin-1-like [Odontomachus brunneus]|uniref:chymotrypsin-1-like n=1 Tax=Odontomachus brunneus TaxID=486640 RepID=UPI0013F268A2|nr:chymotrypsin-1-like [Odontomachus brunneus]
MLPLLAILVLGVFAQQTFADEPEAIVGGISALPGEFPYQCSLQMHSNHFCGGIIASPTCIVTAAHCLDGRTPPPFDTIKVITGSISSTVGRERSVKFGKIHPDYKGSAQYSWKNDVAVLVLKEPLKFNSYQSSIRLATQTPPSGTPCVVTGWGKTSVNSSIEPTLLKAYTTIIDNKTCRDLYNGQPIYDVHLCTFVGHGTGICQGDSGGPLMCNGKLAGIVSWLIPCAVGYPDVFCDVAQVRSFIQSVCPEV